MVRAHLNRSDGQDLLQLRLLRATECGRHLELHLHRAMMRAPRVRTKGGIRKSHIDSRQALLRKRASECGAKVGHLRMLCTFRHLTEALEHAFMEARLANDTTALPCGSLVTLLIPLAHRRRRDLPLDLIEQDLAIVHAADEVVLPGYDAIGRGLDVVRDDHLVEAGNGHKCATVQRASLGQKTWSDTLCLKYPQKVMETATALS